MNDSKYKQKHPCTLRENLKRLTQPADEQLRKEEDNPTIGILLCKNKDKLVVEYALSDINKPMGVTRSVIGLFFITHVS